MLAETTANIRALEAAFRADHAELYAALTMSTGLVSALEAEAEAEAAAVTRADYAALATHHARKAELRAAGEAERKANQEPRQAYYLPPSCGTCAENSMASRPVDCEKQCGPGFFYHPDPRLVPARDPHEGEELA